MIAASAVLVVAALVLLIVGVFQDGLELVFGSIAASIIAAISLFLGVLRDRRAPVTAPGYPVEGAPVGGFAVPPREEEGEAAPASSLLDEELRPEEAAAALTGLGQESSLGEAQPLILPDDEELDVPPAPAPPTAARRARKPAATKRAAAKKPAAKKPATKRKAAAKKPATKKAAKKPAATKRAAAKKPAAKRTAVKKTAAKKTTRRRPSAGS